MSAAYLKKEVIIEGRTKYLVDIIQTKGINLFMQFACINKVPVTMVDTALKTSGLLSQTNGKIVYQKAIEYYRNQTIAMGLKNNHCGFGVKEIIKPLSNNKYRGSFIVDGNLQLMPEVVVHKNTGMFVRVPSDAAWYQNNANIPVYQIMCHPILGDRKAMYIIDLEGMVNENGFGNILRYEFYQPTRIDPTKDLSTTASGLLTTTMPCKLIAKTMPMLHCDALLQAIVNRVMMQLAVKC